MSPLDQYYRNVRNLDYMPRSKYMLNPPTVEDLEKEDEGDVENLIVNPIVPTKNIGGGGITSLPTNQLMTDFGAAVQKRQQNLENPSFIAQKMYDFGFPQQRSVDQMMRDATAFNMAKMGGDTRGMPIFKDMDPVERLATINEYMADETSVGNYPAEDPRDVRFQYGIPNLSSILSRVLPNSYYDKMTVPDQIYTQTKMGYRGPTIFGANDSNLQKDIFGRNIVSGFGNYVEKQKKDIARLDDYFKSDLFAERYGKGTKLEFDEETGQFLFKGPGADAANRMNKLNLIRYNYDKKGLNEFEQIKEDTGYNEVEDARRNLIIRKEGTRRDVLDDRGFKTSGGITTSRAGSENTATGGFGGGADMGPTTSPGTSDQGFTDSGDFAGLKEGGLARILGL